MSINLKPSIWKTMNTIKSWQILPFSQRMWNVWEIFKVFEHKKAPKSLITLWFKYEKTILTRRQSVLSGKRHSCHNYVGLMMTILIEQSRIKYAVLRYFRITEWDVCQFFHVLHDKKPKFYGFWHNFCSRLLFILAPACRIWPYAPTQRRTRKRCCRLRYNSLKIH